MIGKIRHHFTIFGGTGDLTYRKLIPALYNLYCVGKMTNEDRVVAIGRRDYQDDQYHEIIKGWVRDYSRVKFDEVSFNAFLQCVIYYKMDFTNLEEFKQLDKYYQAVDIEKHIFYYAVAPMYFGVITDGLISLGECKNCKVVLEKPFGETLEEANRINTKLERSFGKHQLYRIDHYLGKEMVRSIQTLRFTNPIFMNSWNSKNIDHIQIIANEEVGVETRGNYYDQAGALKDMVQNHLLQILTLLAMEEPDDEHELHERQVDVLRALRSTEQQNIATSLVLGQYTGYTEEEHVNKQSTTETYVGCKVFVDNERWANTPFYIKTGKRMDSREMNVIVTFRNANHNTSSNVLVIKIQPLEGVSLKFNIKKPGDSDEIIQTEMDFCQSCNPNYRINTPEAYERLLDAVICDDQTWFSNWEQIYLSWKYVEELKEKYHQAKLPIYPYAQQTSGPSEDALIFEDDALQWGETQLACRR